MTPSLLGLHHVTAIAGDPRLNVNFYTGVLGLRLVKVTVNVDDPEAYHLYYGDELGRPGTLLTFYCWPGAIRGRTGTGQVIITALAVPPTSLDAWQSRLATYDVPAQGPSPRAGGQVLSFRDLDGLALELVAHPAVARWPAPTVGPIPARQAIRGLFGITMWVQRLAPTDAFLTAALGARWLEEASVGDLRRYRLGRDGPGMLVDVREMPGVGRGLIAVGSVHHVGVRVRDKRALSLWQERLTTNVGTVGVVQDRLYYRSITIEEPGGVRIDLATDGPGVAVDEDPTELGTHLALPPWLEARRPHLARVLPPLHLRDDLT
jgi:catechol 2,3-dioxygenase-like lactoylglutathione lyase family enzyme